MANTEFRPGDRVVYRLAGGSPVTLIVLGDSNGFVVVLHPGTEGYPEDDPPHEVRAFPHQLKLVRRWRPPKEPKAVKPKTKKPRRARTGSR